MPRTNVWGAPATRKYSSANRAQHSMGILALAYVHMGFKTDFKSALCAATWAAIWEANRAALRAATNAHRYR